MAETDVGFILQYADITKRLERLKCYDRLMDDAKRIHTYEAFKAHLDALRKEASAD